MRFLYPAFLAGAAAVAMPIVLHLPAARRRARRAVQRGATAAALTSRPRRRGAASAICCSSPRGSWRSLLLAAAFARPVSGRIVRRDDHRPGHRAGPFLQHGCAGSVRRGVEPRARGYRRRESGRANRCRCIRRSGRGRRRARPRGCGTCRARAASSRRLEAPDTLRSSTRRRTWSTGQEGRLDRHHRLAAVRLGRSTSACACPGASD